MTVSYFISCALILDCFICVFDCLHFCRIAANNIAATTMDENTLQTTISHSDSKEEKSGDISSDHIKIIDDHFETEPKNNIDVTCRHHSSPVEHLVATENVDEQNVSQVPAEVAEDGRNGNGAVAIGNNVGLWNGIPGTDAIEKNLNSLVGTEKPDAPLGGCGSASAENKDEVLPADNQAHQSGDSGGEKALADVSAPPCEKELDFGGREIVGTENIMECDRNSVASQDKTALRSSALRSVETSAGALHKDHSAEETSKLQSSPTTEVESTTSEKGWLTYTKYSGHLK